MKYKVAFVLICLLVFLCGVKTSFYNDYCVSLFVEEMNRKADDIGMKTATFVNPTGLEYGNVGTSDDVIALLDACMLDSTITSIWGLDSATISVVSKNGLRRAIHMQNTFLTKNVYPYSVIGRKTGSNSSIYNIGIVVLNENFDTIKCVILGATTEEQRLSCLCYLLKNIDVNSSKSVSYEFTRGG